jgi:hypothetical protein
MAAHGVDGRPERGGVGEEVVTRADGAGREVGVDDVGAVRR